MIDFQVYTSSNGPLSSEQLADMAANEIVTVSNDAPQPIRDQAHIFREEIKKVVAKYIAQGINSHIKYVINKGQ
jgi:TusA-related sulfurtransferase